jgi:DNA-binding MarR family transcriptional regulator
MTSGNTMGAVTKVSRTKAVQLWEELARAHNTMTAAIEKDMTAAGMPLGWHDVLQHLRRAPDSSMRFQDLAKVEGMSDSGASRRIDQMIKAGLIKRRSCPTDRRGVFAQITAEGESEFRRSHAVFVRSLERNLGSQLQPDEADVVSGALSRLA